VALTDGVFSVEDGTLIYGVGYAESNPSPPGSGGNAGLSKVEEAVAVSFGLVAGMLLMVAAGEDHFPLHPSRFSLSTFIEPQGASHGELNPSRVTPCSWSQHASYAVAASIARLVILRT
jgi:hypothetical protein